MSWSVKECKDPGFEFHELRFGLKEAGERVSEVGKIVTFGAEIANSDVVWMDAERAQATGEGMGC